MKLPPINWPVWCIGLLYGLIETAFFGWHLGPGSAAEVIADGIAFLLFAMAIAFPPAQRPAISIHRLQGLNGESKGLLLSISGDIEIKHAEDLQA